MDFCYFIPVILGLHASAEPGIVCSVLKAGTPQVDGDSLICAFLNYCDRSLFSNIDGGSAGSGLGFGPLAWREGPAQAALWDPVRAAAAAAIRPR